MVVRDTRSEGVPGVPQNEGVTNPLTTRLICRGCSVVIEPDRLLRVPHPFQPGETLIV